MLCTVSTVLKKNTQFYINTIQIVSLPPGKTVMEHIDSKDYPYLDNMLRLSYTIFKLIQDVHNFKILFEHTKVWGVKNNGSWHGAIGFLVRQEVDICLSPLRWSIDRFGIYDETTYIYKLRFIA